MKHVIRACYPSQHSIGKVRHTDRQAERMIEKGYPLDYITEKTGKDIDWLVIIKGLWRREVL